MLDHARIRLLIPHAGSMCLLDRVAGWTAVAITCTATSHLDPANPLRRSGMLATLCGAEYGLQAAALHGALLAGGTPQTAGYLAALRELEIFSPRLDSAEHGRLTVEARWERQDTSGLIYAILLSAESGRPLLRARGAIALPRPAA